MFYLLLVLSLFWALAGITSGLWAVVLSFRAQRPGTKLSFVYWTGISLVSMALSLWSLSTAQRGW